MSFYKDFGGDSGSKVLFQQRVVAPLDKMGFVGRKQILMNMHTQRMVEDENFFAENGDSKVGVSHCIVVAGGPVITWQVWTGDSLQEGKKYFEGLNKQLPAITLENSTKVIDYHKDLQFEYFPFSKAASAYLTEVMLEEVSEQIIEVIADCFTYATLKQQPFCKDMNWKSGQEPVCHTQYLGGKCNVEGDDAFCLRKYKYWFLMIAVLDHTLPFDKYQAQKLATQEFFKWVKKRLAPLRKADEINDPYTGHQQNRIPKQMDGSTENLNYYTKDGNALFSLPAKMQKLKSIKSKYDPHNLFCINFNVSPS